MLDDSAIANGPGKVFRVITGHVDELGLGVPGQDVAHRKSLEGGEVGGGDGPAVEGPAPVLEGEILTGGQQSSA